MKDKKHSVWISLSKFLAEMSKEGSFCAAISHGFCNLGTYYLSINMNLTLNFVSRGFTHYLSSYLTHTFINFFVLPSNSLLHLSCFVQHYKKKSVYDLPVLTNIKLLNHLSYYKYVSKIVIVIIVRDSWMLSFREYNLGTKWT